jgi:hypothetical protein
MTPPPTVWAVESPGVYFTLVLHNEISVVIR